VHRAIDGKKSEEGDGDKPAVDGEHLVGNLLDLSPSLEFL
jgi:hypothetical protein